MVCWFRFGGRVEGCASMSRGGGKNMMRGDGDDGVEVGEGGGG